MLYDVLSIFVKVNENHWHYSNHDDVIKWKYFPLYWPFVRGIHRSPGISPHKGQWCGSLVLSLICAWTNNWANNGDAGDLWRHRAHYDVTVMRSDFGILTNTCYAGPTYWHANSVVATHGDIRYLTNVSSALCEQFCWHHCSAVYPILSIAMFFRWCRLMLPFETCYEFYR